MKSGAVYHPEKLLEQVKGKIGPVSESETESWFKYPELVKETEKLKD
jgi:hypothetical protein